MEPITRNDLINKIKSVMSTRGLRNMDVAWESRISEASVSQALSDKGPPRWEALEKIANSIGIEVKLVQGFKFVEKK